MMAAISLVLVVGFTLWVMPAHAITWGQHDDGKKPKYPEVGAIMYYYADYDAWYPMCSGSLISKDPAVFLTAGHCTYGLTASKVFVSFAYDPLNQKTWYPVSQVITHPSYAGWANSANPYDVGLLILDINPHKLKMPTARLPEQGFLNQLWEAGELRSEGSNEAPFTVVGYGATLEWPPPYIYYEDYRQYAESQFQTLLKAWLVLSQNQARDNGGTCYGDSGGPVFWETDDDRILVGITSWGDMNCVATGFNYRVDISDTLDFISDNIS